MSGPALRRAGVTTVASGLIAAAAIVFLAAMFASFAVGSTSAGRAFGRVNDVLLLVAYLLAAPCVLAVRSIVRPKAPVAADLAAVLGIASIAAIVALQAMLVTEMLTFEEQIGPASIALLALGAWFVIAGRMVTSAGFAPNGVGMGLLAAVYVGYPVWAIWIGRRLIGPTPDPAQRSVVIGAED